jgi:hypothetical protein
VQLIFFPSWWFLEYRRFIGDTYNFWYLLCPQVALLFKKVYIIQWVRGLGHDSGSVEVSGSIPLSSTIFIKDLREIGVLFYA